MNWDTTKIQFNDTNYHSAPLTIKKIEKRKLNNQDCYVVEVEEDITYREGLSQSTFVSKEILTFKYTYKNGNETSEDKDGAKHDTFYFFVHYLNEKIDGGIPFRRYIFSSNRRDRIFRLSDTADFSNQESKDINEIIKGEKEKWDKTGYDTNEKLISENKAIVEAKWDALHKDTNGKEWTPDLSKEEEESIKNASTVAEVQKIQSEITQKRNQDKGDQARQDALTKDPQTGTEWNPPLTEDEKVVINDPNLDTKGAIQAAALLLSYLKNIQKDNGGSGNLTEWKSVETINKAINDFQEAHYTNLLPYWKQAMADNDKGKAWQATNAQFNNIAENVYQRYWQLICNVNAHQKLQEQSTQQKELNQVVLKAIEQINQSCEKANLVPLSKQKEILGESWEKNLANQTSSAAIQEQQTKWINSLEQTQTEQERKQSELEKQIQEKIAQTEDFIQGKDILSANEQSSLLNDLQFFIDNWGLNSQADLAQKAAFHSQQTELLKMFQKLKIQLQREETAQRIRQVLEDSAFPLSANALSENEYRNYLQTLQKHEEAEEIRRLGDKIIADASSVRSIVLHFQHLIKEGEDSYNTKKNSLVSLTNLVQHLNSSANSREKSVSVRLKNQIDPLIEKLTKLERQNASERVKQWLQEQKVSEEDLNKQLGTAYQDYFSRANVQDLLEKRTEDRLKKTVVQLAQQQLEQRALIIDGGAIINKI